MAEVNNENDSAPLQIRKWLGDLRKLGHEDTVYANDSYDQYGHATATFVFVGGTPDRNVTSRWIPGHLADRGLRRAPPRCPR